MFERNSSPHPLSATADKGWATLKAKAEPPVQAQELSNNNVVYASDPASGIIDYRNSGPNAEPDPSQATTAASGQQQNQAQKEQAAAAYSEKTSCSVSECAAIVSVIQNRADPGDKTNKQFVDRGKGINVENVINDKNQLQGVGGKDYNASLNGTAKGAGAANATAAVNLVSKSGPTTDAKFFIVRPGGAAPTPRQLKNLGNVEPASTPKIGDVYLFVQKKPGQ